MSRQRRHRKDDDPIVHEPKQSHSEFAAEIQSEIRRQREFEEFYHAAAVLTPTPLHHDLRRLCENLLLGDSKDFPGRSTSMFITAESIADFLSQLRRAGLIDVVMSNVANDHEDSIEISRGCVNLVPDISVIWPVIRYVLANPGECRSWRWIYDALLSVENYATDRDEAARLLVNYIRDESSAALVVRKMCPNAFELTSRPLCNSEASHGETARTWCLANFVRNASALAAISLSKLAPATPGLVDVLIDAFSHDWYVSADKNDREIGGAGVAAEALGRLGPQGQKAIPELLETALGDQIWLSAGDRCMAFEAYAVLCQDKTAILNLREVFQVKMKLFDERSKVCQGGEQ